MPVAIVIERRVEGVLVDLGPRSRHDSAIDEDLGRGKVAVEQEVRRDQRRPDIGETFVRGIRRKAFRGIGQHSLQRQQIAHRAIVFEAIQAPQNRAGAGAVSDRRGRFQTRCQELDHLLALLVRRLFRARGRHRAQIQAIDNLLPMLLRLGGSEVRVQRIEAAVRHRDLRPVAAEAILIQERPDCFIET